MNLTIVSFTPTEIGLYSPFTVTTGVYVVKGDASSVEMVDRIAVLPGGFKHDPDGYNDTPVYPGQVWWDILFQGATPYAHTQYYNLLDLVGRHGALRGLVRASTDPYEFVAQAKLKSVKGEWSPPYRQATRNTLEVRVTFELLNFWMAD